MSRRLLALRLAGWLAGYSQTQARSGSSSSRRPQPLPLPLPFPVLPTLLLLPLLLLLLSVALSPLAAFSLWLSLALLSDPGICSLPALGY